MVGIKMSFVMLITATMLHMAVNAGLCYANDRSVYKTAFLLSASGMKRRQYDFTSLRVHNALPTSRRRAKFHGGGLTWLLAREGGYGEEWRKPSDTCPSAGTLRNFMLQRAIQTKLYHLNQVRNEPTYEFLQNFLDHQHLQIVRVTDYDFKTLFHGTTGLKVDWEVYLAQLNAIPTKEVTVHFTRRSELGASSSQASVKAYHDVHGQVPPWAEAAASRKANPYLDEWAGLPHVEYKETINAAAICKSLLEIGAQLAQELNYDLRQLSKENERLRLLYMEDYVLRKRRANSSAPLSKDEQMNKFWGEDQSVLPVFMGGTDGMAEVKSDDGEATWEPSVLRTSTWDLSLRLLTKLASLHVLARLSASAEHSSLYQWFKGYLGDKLSAFDGDKPMGVDAEFLQQLMLEPFRVSQAGLIDPMFVADEIIKYRTHLAGEWRQVLSDMTRTWPAYQCKPYLAPAISIADMRAQDKEDKEASSRGRMRENKHPGTDAPPTPLTTAQTQQQTQQQAQQAGRDTFSATEAEEGAGAVPPPVLHLAAAKPPRAKRWEAPVGYAPKELRSAPAQERLLKETENAATSAYLRTCETHAPKEAVWRGVEEAEGAAEMFKRFDAFRGKAEAGAVVEKMKEKAEEAAVVAEQNPLASRPEAIVTRVPLLTMKDTMLDKFDAISTAASKTLVHHFFAKVN